MKRQDSHYTNWLTLTPRAYLTLQWRHNGHDDISNHRHLDCVCNRLFRHRLKKTSKLHVTGLCNGNSLMTSEYPAQRVSNAENVSIWWHHVLGKPQQLSCSDMSKIVTWVKIGAKRIFTRFKLWAHYLFVKWVLASYSYVNRVYCIGNIYIFCYNSIINNFWQFSLSQHVTGSLLIAI